MQKSLPPAATLQTTRILCLLTWKTSRNKSGRPEDVRNGLTTKDLTTKWKVVGRAMISIARMPSDLGNGDATLVCQWHCDIVIPKGRPYRANPGNLQNC